MPDVTVSAGVDSMLRSANDAAIRSAIGVGTTDAPTFLAQTLTGQSLTGTQATSLVDMAATWNTTGTPIALKLNVTDTASNAASNLMDLQKGGVSQFSVTKAGALVLNDVSAIRAVPSSGWIEIGAKANVLAGATSRIAMWETGLGLVQLANNGSFAWSELAHAANGSGDLAIYRDAKGILAQRNGTLKQVLRVYNTALSGAPEWGGFDWQTTSNTLRIGTDKSGTGASHPIDFVVGGAVKMSISSGGDITPIMDSTGSIGTNALRFNSVRTNTVFCTTIASYAAGAVIRLLDGSGVNFNILQMGGGTSAFPGIKRNGTAINIVLADDSAPAPLNAGAIGSGAAGSAGQINVLNSTGAAVTQMSSNPTYGYHMAAGIVVSWGSGTSLNGSLDTALARPAGGTVKVTDGSTGTGTIIAKLPTSSAGLASGTVWNNAGVVSIIP